MTALTMTRPLMSCGTWTRRSVTGRFQRIRNSRRTRRQRSEQGSILAMTCIFMTMFLALAGLVADGGHYFDAKEAAASEAEQAARAGASALDVSALHAGTVAVEPNTAVGQAEDYMVASGQPGTAWVQGNTVYAQISYRQPTQLLGIIGVGSLQINVTESATDVSGVASGG
jgi:Flp pilus assembly protein TadG